MVSKMMKECFPGLKTNAVCPQIPNLVVPSEGQLALSFTAGDIPRSKIPHATMGIATRDNWDIPLDQLAIRSLKRALDVIVAVIVIVIIFPWLIPLVGLCITMDSPGPIFFLQKRNGRNGAPFTCLKFRSMRLNRQSDIAPASQDDPRITRIGRILRSYCIDEFPQFLNVLKGDMTLVGPRPHMIEENQVLSRSIPGYAFRFRVKPGITGLGQLQSHTRGTRLERMTDRTYWDAFYMLNWSVKMEMKILLTTLVFCCHGGNKSSSAMVRSRV
jgi:putative colanic acid biosynthesis UDP-glucose lipid carrier transferase